ncbi:MAG: ATP-dependent DNA helicase RecG, partial [bacterium]
DLLYFFPFRYEDFSRVALIAELMDGENVTIKGKIEVLGNKRSWKKGKMITEALVSDSSGSVRVVWFNQPYIAKVLKPGDEIYLSGKVKSDMLGPQFASPAYEKSNRDETTHTARLVPIYPATEGLSQKQIRFLVSQVLPLAEKITEWLPEEFLEKNDLVPLPASLKGIHFPVDEIDLKKSTERLKFGELFLLQLKAELTRREKMAVVAPALSFKEKEIQEFVKKLPFTLTKTQKVATWDILRDIKKTVPMNRLLSGDVGSGKTVVAAISMLDAVLNGYQAVLMAPTEILAKQHYDSLCKLYEGSDVKVGLLTRSQALNFQFSISNLQSISNDSVNKRKKSLIKEIKDGQVQIVVGTHALLSEKVEMKNLGLVVVDEQHRFGVEQRKMIKNKGKGAHFLSMTATPIPRSLALMIYGDLEVSTINEMPPGRKPIITRLVESHNRQKAYDFIRAQIKQGRQAFVICPLISNPATCNAQCDNGQDDTGCTLRVTRYASTVSDEKKAVLSEYEKLSKTIFPDLRVGFLHGKLKPTEKEKIMDNFSTKGGKNHVTDILVSTSVVEVGVDIPNASVMMIEGAEKFGLAQLHQFRGRVGRSSNQSYCLLFSDSLSKKAEERLKFFEKTLDGFKLAEKDLSMRGPGQVYGTLQSGLMNLRLAKLTDTDIIKKARETAKTIVADLNNFPSILRKIKEWEGNVHLE